MGRTCRGICLMYKADPVPNKVRYKMGQKRCTFCGLFLTTEKTKCLCCQSVLRTKARGKSSKGFEDHPNNLE